MEVEAEVEFEVEVEEKEVELWKDDAKEVEKEVVDNEGLAVHKECNSKIINETDLNKNGTSRKSYYKKEIKKKVIKRPPVKVNYFEIVMTFYIFFEGFIQM